MYEWLEEELERVKTPHFHEVDGPTSDELRTVINESSLFVPPSYKEFVIRFGNTKLYRISSWYQVEVYSAPREVESGTGESLLNFGRTDLGLVYFKTALLVPNGESPVFEWNGSELGWKQSADGFEDWLIKKCDAAKQRIKKKEWKKILTGPEPFSPRELEIVKAREKFRWRVVGVSPNGNVQIEVLNGSTIVLPYLTIGIRGKTDKVKVGGVKLPVSDLQPSNSKVLEVDCYKQWYDPFTIEPFDEPDPEPSTRDLYWEFRGFDRCL